MQKPSAEECSSVFRGHGDTKGRSAHQWTQKQEISEDEEGARHSLERAGNLGLRRNRAPLPALQPNQVLEAMPSLRT